MRPQSDEDQHNILNGFPDLLGKINLFIPISYACFLSPTGGNPKFLAVVYKTFPHLNKQAPPDPIPITS